MLRVPNIPFGLLLRCFWKASVAFLSEEPATGAGGAGGATVLGSALGGGIGVDSQTSCISPGFHIIASGSHVTLILTGLSRLAGLLSAPKETPKSSIRFVSDFLASATGS